MRLAIWTLLAVLACGCGVSKDLYQQQLVRSQGLSAQVDELQARLQAEEAEKLELGDDLDSCRAGTRVLDDELRMVREGIGDASGQLDACLSREEALHADLDVARRVSADRERDLERLRDECREAALAGEEREGSLADQREAARQEVADLQSRIYLLLAEKERVEREKREKLDEISGTYQGLLEGMREQVEAGRVTISKLEGQLRVELLDEILFDSGSAAVKPDGRQILAQIVSLIDLSGQRGLLVEGHTDNVPISGTLAERFPSNWELSAARALSVVRYLEGVVGIDPRRLGVLGYGEHRPAVPNDSPEQRARNRRIELKLVPLAPGVLSETGQNAPAEDEQPSASERSQ